MLELVARLFQPGIERIQILEGRCALPDAMPGVLNILLDLSLLPARGRIAELGFEQKVADHGLETGVDVPGLAFPDSIHRRLHIVVDTTPGNPAHYPEGVVVGIEQHFVRLQRIGPQEEGPTVRELELGDLQLGLHAGNDRPVFAPVELEGFTWGKGQRNEGATTGRPGSHLLRLSPIPGKGGDPVIGTFVPQRGKVGIDLPEIASLLAILLRLRLQPCSQFRRKPVELARALSIGILRLDDAGAQILPDRVSG